MRLQQPLLRIIKGRNMTEPTPRMDHLGVPLPPTKRLRITYGGNDLFDAEVLSLTYAEDDGTVTVTGRTKPKPTTNWADLLKVRPREADEEG